MAYEFRQTRRVEFADTDLAGIVHFANFFRYMENTEHAFLRSLGLTVHDETGGRLVGWPRVRAECAYASPLMFEDEVHVQLLVREKKSRTITYEFRFFKDGQDKPVARGTLTVACVTRDAAGRLVSIDIPERIDRLIEVAPSEIV